MNQVNELEGRIQKLSKVLNIILIISITWYVVITVLQGVGMFVPLKPPVTYDLRLRGGGKLQSVSFSSIVAGILVLLLHDLFQYAQNEQRLTH